MTFNWKVTGKLLKEHYRRRAVIEGILKGECIAKNRFRNCIQIVWEFGQKREVESWNKILFPKMDKTKAFINGRLKTNKQTKKESLVINILDSCFWQAMLCFKWRLWVRVLNDITLLALFPLHENKFLSEKIIFWSWLHFLLSSKLKKKTEVNLYNFLFFFQKRITPTWG